MFTGILFAALTAFILVALTRSTEKLLILREVRVRIDKRMTEHRSRL